MYTGRVSREKNLEAFLDLDVSGSKVVIGAGPDLDLLKQRYPEAHFLGYQHGEDLAKSLACADVFVFPSRTDTLGLVMLEALACGVPVAAFPVPGPIDLIFDGANGALDENLTAAYYRALSIEPEACVEFAERFSWERCTAQFVKQLRPITETASKARTDVADQDRAAAHRDVLVHDLPYNRELCESPHLDQKAESIALSS